MRYLQSFSTSGDVQAAIDNGLLAKPYVAYIESDDAIDWNTTEKTDYSKKYLTFNIISGGTINWQSNRYQKTIEYKINDGEWTSITSRYGNPPSFNVNNGDTVILRGNNNTYESDNCSFAASSTAVFSVCGNIMSLVYGDDFNNKKELTSDYTFSYLFKCTGLTSAEHLVLPATTLTYGCYQRMFSNCTSLTTAPSLPATTLADYCYYYMFLGCTSLNYIKCLATDISASQCTNNWVNGVASTGTFVKDASMTGWETGASGIPEGWTVIDA